MKVLPEAIAVHPDTERREIAVLMDGHRIALSSEEARLLARRLVESLDELMEIPGEADGVLGEAALAKL